MRISSSNKPVIVISSGDPAGIGPEITRKALSSGKVPKGYEYIVVGAAENSVKLGKPTRVSGQVGFANLVKSVDMLSSVKGRKALVTAPVSKEALWMAGHRFSGQTEILSELHGQTKVTMMFSAALFHVALVTRHIPLSRVPKELTKDSIEMTCLQFYSCLRAGFKIKKPRIGIAGLNPHAGENGLLGNEEKNIIKPVLKTLAKKYVGFKGPYPADIVFKMLYEKKLDGVVAMYHDQGLAPFKMLFFDKGVNVTLGLPYVRTSPDHGTAYDIAGKGVADPSSMIAAIQLAARLA